MTNWLFGDHYQIHILETPEAMTAVEDLQRVVWPGNETDIVPAVPGHAPPGWVEPDARTRDEDWTRGEERRATRRLRPHA